MNAKVVDTTPPVVKTRKFVIELSESEAEDLLGLCHRVSWKCPVTYALYDFLTNLKVKATEFYTAADGRVIIPRNLRD
jgi:hypothetical protein